MLLEELEALCNSSLVRGIIVGRWWRQQDSDTLEKQRCSAEEICYRDPIY